MRRILLLSLALPFLLGSKAVGQTCVGMPSFSSGQMQVGAGGQFADGTSSFAGTFGLGRPNGFYGKAALGTTSYDGLSGSSLDFGVNGGYQVALKNTRGAQLCPVASLSIGSGPNDVGGAGLDMSSRTFSFGALPIAARAASCQAPQGSEGRGAVTSPRQVGENSAMYSQDRGVCGWSSRTRR